MNNLNVLFFAAGCLWATGWYIYAAPPQNTPRGTGGPYEIVYQGLDCYLDGGEVTAIKTVSEMQAILEREKRPLKLADLYP